MLCCRTKLHARTTRAGRDVKGMNWCKFKGQVSGRWNWSTSRKQATKAVDDPAIPPPPTSMEVQPPRLKTIFQHFLTICSCLSTSMFGERSPKFHKLRPGIPAHVKRKETPVNLHKAFQEKTLSKAWHPGRRANEKEGRSHPQTWPMGFKDCIKVQKWEFLANKVTI